MLCVGLVCVTLDSEGELLEEKKEFPKVLFLMHRWFIPSEELAQKFLDLYPTCH